MTPIATFIVLGAIMWILSSLFGFFQIKDFNKNYIELRNNGKVAIGRKKGYFTAGTIVMILIDDEGIVISSRKVQGVTVMARVKTFKGLEGLALSTMTKEDIKKYNKYMRMAILDAINNYNNFIGGDANEKIEEKKGVIEFLFNKTKTFIRR